MNSNMSLPRLLIADDEPVNLRALAETLRGIGEITIAKNGTEAIERAHAIIPDLMLLDINMPKPDGYQVCQLVRETPELARIPVIFITTLDAEEDESRGFAVGGTDYITKPFSPEITRARVQTQLELKRHRDDLEALAEARARQLIHAERLATLGTLAAGIAHEINNPLTCIAGYAEFMLRNYKQIPADLLNDDPNNPLVSFVHDVGEYLKVIEDSADRIACIVAGMKSHSKREDDILKPHRLADCVTNSLNLCDYTIQKILTVEQDIPEDLPKVPMRPQQIEQVLINLIINAAHAIEQTGETGTLSITARADGDRVTIVIQDSGPGIPPAKLENIWEAFYTSKGEKGTGLGLSISRGIINDHRGSIHAENAPEGGARFTIHLPCRQ